MIEHRFLYFPESHLHSTPAVLQMRFEEVYFDAADGVPLHGWYIPGRRGMPVVLFCHGNAGNIADRVRMLGFLKNLGVSTFIFDYRGYGQSQGKANEEGTYNDARGALAWLKKRGWDPAQTIYLGRSMGAAVATQMAVEQAPARLVLECPFTSIAEMGRLHYPLLYRFACRLIAARYDNVAKIGQITSPLLLSHGTDDNVVPVSMGMELFDRARSPKQLLLVEGGGHSDAYILKNRPYFIAWLKFVDLDDPELPENHVQTIPLTASAPDTMPDPGPCLSTQDG
ncbi:MAG: alpha/beta hydrolase [Desulfuromonadales bacterium]|jgi:fermentation-respiration switch protein FrsA (DUF1100 family)